MPDRYISDDQVTINTQGLRTVRREDRPWAAPGSQWILDWSYKGQEHFYRYPDQAARDAMYNALRKALAEKEQRQLGYRKIDAIKLVRELSHVWGYDMSQAVSKAIVEALEPLMRPGESQPAQRPNQTPLGERVIGGGSCGLDITRRSPGEQGDAM